MNKTGVGQDVAYGDTIIDNLPRGFPYKRRRSFIEDEPHVLSSAS